MRGQSNHSSRFIEMFETTVHVYEEIPITALCYTDDDIKCGPFGTQLKQSEYQENGVAVWGIPQINSGFSIAPDTFVTPEKAKRLEQFSLISGDIAMSRKGNVGQCALFPDNFEKGIIASDVVRIRVNKDLIMPQFLVYQLHNSHKVRRQILNVSDGSIMAGINVTKLKKIHVYSPPLERQKQFVSIVRQVDKSKFTNFKSRFISRFLGSSYSQKRLGEVANVFSGKTINLELENEGGPIAYLKVADLNLPENDRVVTTSSRFVTEETARTSGLVPIGATIFPKNGAAALHNKKRITSVTTCVDMNTMAVYSTSNTVIPEYLYAYLESQDLAALTLVGAIPQIRAKDVQSLVIPVPPIREQEQYVAVMHQADKSKYLS